jgi:hypothetical protein
LRNSSSVTIAAANGMRNSQSPCGTGAVPISVGARGVLEPCEALEDQLLFQLLAREFSGQPFRRKCQNAQSALGHHLLLAHDPRARGVIERDHIA